MPSRGGRGEAKGGWNSDFVADLQANTFLVHCSSLRTVSPPPFADICDVTRVKRLLCGVSHTEVLACPASKSELRSARAKGF